MFQRFQCTKAISYSCLTFVHKLCYNFSYKFSSNNSNDGFEANLENTSISKLLDDAGTFADIQNTEWATTPYPATGAFTSEDVKPRKPSIDPLNTSVILFPGQGIVKVGAVEEYMKYPRVKELFDIANEILGYNLLHICRKGPQNILNRTEFNQPATVVISLAALEKLQEERPRAIESCVATAGYSVGELTSLIFSGVLNYEEGLHLVGIRAAAMQSASELSSQGMLSCYCTPQAKVSQLCKDAEKWALDIGASNPVCRIASYLYTQGKVFGGCKEALDYIEKNSLKLGLRKVTKLPVTGAFHTSLMEPALKSFIKAIDKICIDKPSINVYSNCSANTYNDNLKISRKYLIKQIVSPVKWEQIIQKLYERPEGTNFPRSFDVGSGGTMKTILKMINAKAADQCLVY